MFKTIEDKQQMSGEKQHSKEKKRSLIRNKDTIDESQETLRKKLKKNKLYDSNEEMETNKIEDVEEEEEEITRKKRKNYKRQYIEEDDDLLVTDSNLKNPPEP